MEKNIIERITDNEETILYEELETEHGIFTSNLELQLTAQEAYEKYLYDLENPQKPKPGLEEVVKEQQDKITILEAEKKHLKQITKEQDDLLVDNAYKITMLEMSIGGI